MLNIQRGQGRPGTQGGILVTRVARSSPAAFFHDMSPSGACTLIH